MPSLLCATSLAYSKSAEINGISIHTQILTGRGVFPLQEGVWIGKALLFDRGLPSLRGISRQLPLVPNNRVKGRGHGVLYMQTFDLCTPTIPVGSDHPGFHRPILFLRHWHQQLAIILELRSHTGLPRVDRRLRDGSHGHGKKSKKIEFRAQEN